MPQLREDPVGLLDGPVEEHLRVLVEGQLDEPLADVRGHLVQIARVPLQRETIRICVKGREQAINANTTRIQLLFMKSLYSISRTCNVTPRPTGDCKHVISDRAGEPVARDVLFFRIQQSPGRF